MIRKKMRQIQIKKYEGQILHKWNNREGRERKRNSVGHKRVNDCNRTSFSNNLKKAMMKMINIFGIRSCDLLSSCGPYRRTFLRRPRDAK